MDPHAAAAAAALLLSAYVPPSVLIDEGFRILHFYGDNSSFIRLSSGRASLLLPALLREELLSDLYILMDRVKRDRRPARMDGMEIAPVGKMGEINTFLVVFKEEVRVLSSGKDGQPQKTEKDHTLAGLRRKLDEMTRRMQSIGEESEQVLLQLQAANEEVLSANEELQSINEELEVSREELQSVIGEMKSINETLQNKNDQLKAAASYAEAIVGTIREPLLILFSDLRIQSANKAFYSSYQLSPEKVEGYQFQEAGEGLFDKETLLEPLRAMVSAREMYRDFESTVMFPEKGERILYVTATRMNGAPGRRARVALIIEDMTDQRAAERQKNEFIGIASHELKTPITSIHAYTQILYNAFIEADDQRSLPLISKLNKQVTRLTNLTRDLLDVTRISEGQLRLHEAWYDPAGLISEVCDMMQEGVRQRIVADLPPDLPQIWGDRQRIGQVLVNLLSNAIKYTADAGEILLRARVRGAEFVIVVKDSGMGIAEEIRKKIFDRFFRAGGASVSAPQGLGLGLYIANEIVRQHGGRITADSEIGKGSVFSVLLPIQKSGS